jgi:hypothetical protein
MSESGYEVEIVGTGVNRLLKHWIFMVVGVWARVNVKYIN